MSRLFCLVPLLQERRIEEGLTSLTAITGHVDGLVRLRAAAPTGEKEGRGRRRPRRFHRRKAVRVGLCRMAIGGKV